jgi:hypothetical protein
MRTHLRENSLLTGKNTGDFMHSDRLIPSATAVNASFWIASGPNGRFSLDRTGNYQRHIREFRAP